MMPMPKPLIGPGATRSQPDRTADACASLRRAVCEGTPVAGTLGITQAELEALYVIAHAKYLRADFDGARTVFARLVQLSHLDARFLMGLGGCEQMLGRHSHALLQYVAAGMVRPADPDPMFHSAQCLIALDAVTQAKEALVIACARASAPEHEGVRLRAQTLLNDLEVKQS